MGITGYYASETSTTPSASASGWTAITSTPSYSASVSFTLSGGDGTKTVYVWFKDAAENVSASVSDNIILSRAPSAPTSVSASAGNGQVTISWNSVSGATGYNIYWLTTSGAIKTNGTKISGATSPYIHTALTNGTTYYYVVTAVNSYGESAESSEASSTPTPWTISTIDSMSQAGTAIAVDLNGKVHISYCEATGATFLKYATNTSGSWQKYGLEAAGGVISSNTSIATDSNNKAHVSYQSFYYNARSLKYATNASGSWVFTIVDSTGNAGFVNALTLDSFDKVHIAYTDDYNSDKKYATNGSSNWTTALIEDDIGSSYMDIARDTGDKLYVSYWSVRDNVFKYATNVSGAWISSIVDDSGTTMSFNSIALDSNNKIHISYRDDYYGALKYATNLSGSWTMATIDDPSGIYDGVGYFNSMAIDSNNKIHISYYDYSNRCLKYATNVTGTWMVSVVDSIGDVGLNTSIAIGLNNAIHIVYYDKTYGQLKYATKSAN